MGIDSASLTWLVLVEFEAMDSGGLLEAVKSSSGYSFIISKLYSLSKLS